MTPLDPDDTTLAVVPDELLAAVRTAGQRLAVEYEVLTAPLVASAWRRGWADGYLARDNALSLDLTRPFGDRVPLRGVPLRTERDGDASSDDLKPRADTESHTRPKHDYSDQTETKGGHDE